MPRAILLLGLLLAPSAAFAQAFAAPMPGLSGNTPTYAILRDGTRIEGKVTVSMGMNGGLTSFTIVDAAGEKHKLKADDVAELHNTPSVLARLAATSEVADSALAALHRLDEYAAILNTKEAIYRQIAMPGKGREALVQLLNPGFDSVFGVYADNTDDGDEVMGQAVTVESFLVTKRGGQAFQVKKVQYKKMFPELFGDCAEVAAMVGERKPDFDSMATHVFAYTHYCGAK